MTLRRELRDFYSADIAQTYGDRWVVHIRVWTGIGGTSYTLVAQTFDDVAKCTRFARTELEKYEEAQKEKGDQL